MFRCVSAGRDAEDAAVGLAVPRQVPTDARVVPVGHVHGAVGADGDVAIYNDDPNREAMFQHPRYLLKGGHVIVEEGDERARIWKQMAEIYPPYDDYQKNAGERVIPVVVLDPI